MDDVIHDATTLTLPGRLKADLCVIGSGPGGATAAALAAEAGLRVVVLEAGSLITPARSTQREEQMLPSLLWDAGARTTRDRAVRVVQGRGVGGSSLHNLNLCKRAPGHIRDAWARDARLAHLSWDPLYAEVEQLLEVSEVPAALRSRPNRLLQQGCEALGWRGGPLRHNRTGCVQSGFCELGCAYDAKNNALKRFIPRVVGAGGVVLARAQATRVLHRAGRVHAVEAVARVPESGEILGTLTIEAPRVCVSASATGTPALLLRSAIPDPTGRTGRGLHIHPAVLVAGDFDAPVEAWRGIPQSYECTEWLDLEHETARTWIVPAFGHPMAVAAMIPGHGAEHAQVMARFAHLSALTAMLHDHTAGRVTPHGELDLRVDYWPEAADRAELARGLSRCARLLLAAGARHVLVPGEPVRTIRTPAEADALAGLDIQRGDLDISAVHPMGGVPMDDDPRHGVVDSRGRHHHLDGLWVADGSLIPTSIGVPPQLTIYALGLHVGRHLAKS
jgi:choline dehydrogenase-like flavoprotein